VVPKIFENDSYSSKLSKKLESSKVLMVPITSDRGLCGGINSNLLRELKVIVDKDRSRY